eukprot:2128623-Amphidinium_carterae.1
MQGTARKKQKTTNVDTRYLVGQMIRALGSYRLKVLKDEGPAEALPSGVSFQIAARRHYNSEGKGWVPQTKNMAFERQRFQIATK